MQATDFGALGELPLIEEVQERINTRYDNLFHTDVHGKRHPYVCTICDEILFCRREVNWLKVDDLKKQKHLVEWSIILLESERVLALEAAYRVHDPEDRLKNPKWLEGLALSPRGIVGRKSKHHSSKWGFSCCCDCLNGIKNKRTPFNAIVNRNYVGNAPECLQVLTEVERSLITPVQGYGYCFSYVGGQQKNLKGTMTFMRIEERKIARAAIHLECMGLAKHVVVLLTGKLTKKQKARVEKKKEIRTDKILEAVQWLSKNHKRWKNVDLDEFRKELAGATPVVVDNSSEVDSENANVEEQELFTCYFPDGATNERAGGFDDPEAFKTYVNEMKEKNFNVELQLQLGKEFVQSGDGDPLVNSSLLQFPYGVGGMDERRVLADGSFSDRPDTEMFLQHLSRISQPVFQEPMFQLVMYSLISKHRLLKRSKLQLRGKKTASEIANGINAFDVSSAIRGRRAGNRNAGTKASKKLLNAVDACSQALPHTNEAAKNARATAETIQHHFGIGSVFLTVSFDDENSFLLQVLSREEVDDDTPVEHLSDDELAKRAARRRELRLEFPGLASMNFEMLLQVLTEEVVGWDIRRNCATDAAGLFGICEALTMAIEEQGRKTLHVHMTIWIKGFRDLQRSMFFGGKAAKATADTILASYHDRVVTTSLFKPCTRTLRRAFDHKCVVSLENRTLPNVVDQQSLRNLRHKHGYQVSGGRFGYCFHCNKQWTYEELLDNYVRRSGNMDDPTSTGCRDPEEDTDGPSIPRARMLATIIEFQKETEVEVADTPALCINATYQHHLSCHVRGCFKCNKKSKSKHTCGPLCECRFRLPDRARLTCLLKTTSDGQTWFEWNGDSRLQPIVEFLPKRGKYDLFQNVSCRAISESKFSCNSNMALITDGPVGQYQFKYHIKKTQDDDTAEYAEVEKSIKSMNGRTHEDDRNEARRLICRAAFAHNKTNIIGAPLASYLNRHGSRFYFSHDTTYCPLRDLVRLANSETVPGIARYNNDGSVYFENQALHYLCRHDDLEDIPAKDFYTEYTVLTVPGKNTGKRKRDDEETWRFKSDTGHFQHPSAKKTKDGRLNDATQGVKKKDAPTLARISQWMIPDTAKFKDNIFACPPENITKEMEIYAELFLTLLVPHRHQDDLKSHISNGRRPFTMKFRELKEADHEAEMLDRPAKVITPENLQFMQNIQDCAYNSLRYKPGDDDLQSATAPFCTGDAPTDAADDSDEEDDDSNDVPYDLFVDTLDDVDITDKFPDFLPKHMQGLSFNTIRNRGSGGCGYNRDIPTAAPLTEEVTNENDFVNHPASNNRDSTSTANTSTPDERRKYSVKDIVNVLLRRTVARTRKEVFKDNKDVEVAEANGSVVSIVEWAKAAQLDPYQRRAFEAIIASFLLTFYDTNSDDEQDATIDRSTRSKFRRSQLNLRRLRGSKTDQLICLLHGPGGSGKSTVINLVTAYAREYCELLKHPFTARTIVVTAMSGVAATLLHGETTHSALGLNKDRLSEDEIEAWTDARLVIIDEISFAAEADFDKIYSHTQELMRAAFKAFGGLNIVFAGDYSQLEPPRREPIYAGRRCPTFHDALNTFIELDGMHRFKDDLEWGHRLLRFREGEPTVEDIRVINDCCAVSEEHVPPSDIQIATYKNRDRDAINSAIFEEYCKANKPDDDSLFLGAIVVLMDELEMQDSRDAYVSVQSNAVKRHFWANCGEDSCKFTGHSYGRVDPVLKLYPKAPLMLTKNKDVPNGKANGSRVFLKKVNIKVGEQPFELRLACGTTIRAFLVSQVDSLCVQHETTDIIPQQFEVKSEPFTFHACLPLGDEDRMTKMKGNQIPVISNSATTGHKLQGYTAHSLFASDWHYQQNWAYVVLSRVRTMAGLFIAKPLSEQLSKYMMPAAMKAMLKDFRERILLQTIDDEVYNKMFAEESR